MRASTSNYNLELNWCKFPIFETIQIRLFTNLQLVKF